MLGGARLTEELRIAAGPGQLRLAREYVEHAATAFGLEDRECYEVVVAVNEAVTNAIRHGAPDERGHVRLQTRIERERLTFIVLDSGSFEPAPGVAAGGSGGRGLGLMASLMDEMVLRTGPAGTAVELSRIAR